MILKVKEKEPKFNEDTIKHVFVTAFAQTLRDCSQKSKVLRFFFRTMSSTKLQDLACWKIIKANL